jgi:hypothetical protein
MMKLILLFRGWIRYQLKVCPACAGNWPADRYCMICANYGNAKCPDAITCLAWWRRYKESTLSPHEVVVWPSVSPSPSPSPSPSAWKEDELEEIEKILREGRASNE